ncbi:hypothetical protein [Terribacillus saccharophilus]|uniref:hypothetical protein n=1 Tax=Terribacillus saccharophilus TaxID=361277 RepID=UPI000F4EECF5|nr:hypothetical protein [Terribacillus goriensis]
MELRVVEPSELRDCVKIQVYGDIQGKKVEVLKERNDEYQVSTGSLLVGEDLKLPRIDRDAWLRRVPKSDVKLIEDIIPFDPSIFKIRRDRDTIFITLKRSMP